MPGVKFTIDTDVGGYMRAKNIVVAGEQEMKRGFEEYVGAAERASDRVVAAYGKISRSAELAAEQPIEFAPSASLRTSGSSSAGRRRAYSLAAQSAPSFQPTLIARSKEAELEFADDVAAHQALLSDAAKFSFARKIQSGKERDLEELRAAITHSGGVASSIDRGIKDRAGIEAANQLEELRAAITHSGGVASSIDRGIKDRAGIEAANQQELGQTLSFNAFEARINKSRQSRDSLFTGLGVGLTAATVAIYAADQAAEKYAGNLARINDAGVGFEKQLTPLLSLGNNLQHADRIRERVLALSASKGIETQPVADAMFMLQSAAANMSDSQRESILSSSLNLKQVAGGDLQTNIVAVTKLMQTYGREMGTAEMAASKLMITEDKSSITLQELSELLPDVLPAAKLMGITYDEIAASVMTATKNLGSNEKTLTGLRNVFLKLGEAQAQGLVHAGSLVDKLMELDQLEPVKLEKFFGLRNATVAAVLADKTAEIAKNMRSMESVNGTEIAQKLALREIDPQARLATISQGLDQTAKNNDIVASADGERRLKAIYQKLAKQGFDESLIDHPLLASLPEGARNFMIAEAGYEAYENREGDPNTNNAAWLKLALNKDLAEKRSHGDKESLFEANLEAIQFGGISDTFVTDGNGKKRWTTSVDADRYARLYALKGIGYKDFMNVENFEARGRGDEAKKIIDSYKDLPQPSSAVGAGGSSAEDKFEAAVDKFSQIIDKMSGDGHVSPPKSAYPSNQS